MRLDLIHNNKFCLDMKYPLTIFLFHQNCKIDNKNCKSIIFLVFQIKMIVFDHCASIQCSVTKIEKDPFSHLIYTSRIPMARRCCCMWILFLISVSICWILQPIDIWSAVITRTSPFWTAYPPDLVHVVFPHSHYEKKFTKLMSFGIN